MTLEKLLEKKDYYWNLCERANYRRDIPHAAKYLKMATRFWMAACKIAGEEVEA